MKSIIQTLALTIFIGQLPQIALSQAIEINGIVATINGRVITKHQIAVLVAPEIRSLSEQFPQGGPKFDRAVQDASENMRSTLINRLTTIQGGKALGIQIGDPEVDARIAKEIHDHYGGNRDEFRKFLRSRRTPLEDFRSYMRDELLEDAILRRQGNKK